MTVFEKIISKEIAATIVFENPQVMAIRDIHPQAHVHVLFIHKIKSKDIDEMVSTLLEKYDSDGKLKCRSTPALPNVYYEPNTNGLAEKQMHDNYRELIGSYIWMATSWRPDISFITMHLDRFVSNPSVEHYEAAIGILKYLLQCLKRR